MTKKASTLFAFGLSLSLAVSGCGPKKPRTPATAQQASETSRARVAPPTPPPATGRPSRDSSDITPIDSSADIRSMTLEALNAAAPLADIHFEYDSAVLSEEARDLLANHARWLNSHPTVTATIEGHCDERGTVEYNLALGDRRSIAAFNYLVSLGVASGRMKTISYGKEFPLDPGHREDAWAKNRRARFLITAK